MLGNKIFIVIILLSLTTSLIVIAYSSTTSSGNYVFYIYGDPSCPHCSALKQFLTKTYGSSHVYFCNVAANSSCTNHFLELSVAIASKGWIPTTLVVVDCKTTGIVIGEVEDKGFWDKLLSSKPSNNITVYMSTEAWEAITVKNNTLFTSKYAPAICRFKTTSQPGNVTVSWRRKPSIIDVLPSLIILSLLDSVNPCMITLYTVFLATLLPRKNITVPGLAFILIIFTGYYLFGLGLTWLAYIVPRWVYLSLAAIFAFYNIIEASHSKGLKECRECKRVPLKKFISRPILGAVILGLFSVSVLLPCTSGPLLLFASMITGMDTYSQAISLALYTTLFITPLIIIYASMKSLRRSRRIINWVDKHTPLLGFTSSIILLLIVFIIAVS